MNEELTLEDIATTTGFCGAATTDIIAALEAYADGELLYGFIDDFLHEAIMELSSRGTVRKWLASQGFVDNWCNNCRRERTSRPHNPADLEGVWGCEMCGERVLCEECKQGWYPSHECEVPA